MMICILKNQRGNNCLKVFDGTISIWSNELQK